MKTQLLVVLILVCSGCQLGKIPCPDARGPRAKKVKVSPKRHSEFTASIASRRPQPETKALAHQGKETDTRYVQNVSVEEWDCPRPGEKKYMPRSVKGNIKRNFKKINAEQNQRVESDTLDLR